MFINVMRFNAADRNEIKRRTYTLRPSGMKSAARLRARSIPTWSRLSMLQHTRTIDLLVIIHYPTVPVLLSGSAFILHGDSDPKRNNKKTAFKVEMFAM